MSSFVLHSARNHKEMPDVEAPKVEKTRVNNAENVGFILHPASILHPILHPKFPMYKGNFKDWCRKCRRKTQNFFWRRGFGKPKTSDFFEANLRTFEAKHRNFILKKSDVFGFRTGSELSKKTALFANSNRTGCYNLITIYL